jgi:DNA-binding transcriptional regulator PaaX
MTDMYKIGPVKRKILLALLGGVALGFSSDPRQYYRNLRLLRSEWRKVNQQAFTRSIRRLSKEKLLEEKRLPNSSFKLVLTARGKREAKILDLLGNSINFKKPKRWDGKWRLVLFDVPEKDRIFRDILREHLRNLKFLKLQHSVFVSPYPFEKPISKLVEIYSARPYVRIVTAERIDNEATLKKYFSK